MLPPRAKKLQSPDQVKMKPYGDLAPQVVACIVPSNFREGREAPIALEAPLCQRKGDDSVKGTKWF